MGKKAPLDAATMSAASNSTSTCGGRVIWRTADYRGRPETTLSGHHV
jgi:hypothetical protein